MFYCPTCAQWVVETALSKALGPEVAKLEHDITRHHPQWAKAVQAVGAIGTAVLVSWVASKVTR